MTDEKWLREVLDDAVSDVEPRNALDSIRSRTKVTPMSNKRPWIYGAGGALLATAATITAFALVTGGNGNNTARDPGFVGSPSPTASPDPDPVLVPVYYLGEVSFQFGESGEMQTGFRLFREWAEADGNERAGTLVATAVERMFEPPTDPDYSTPWNSDVDVLEISHEGGVVNVDLTGPVQDMNVGAESAELAVQQLVYTVQGVLAVMKDDAAKDPVRILVDGAPIGDLWGHVDASEPIARAPRTGTQAPIWIIEPQDSAAVEQPVTVSGVAEVFEGNVRVFEGNVSWRLLQNGTEVDSGFTTASQGAPGLGDYSFELGGLDPGEYVVEVFESSALDGSPINMDTKQFTIE